MIEGLKEQPFVSHLIELRDRLLRAMIAVGVIFLCLFPFNNDIYVMVATPLMAHLPEGSTMIATEVASPFLTPFKLTLMAAVFLGMPFILYQLWMFIAPGLYKHEKRLMMPLVGSSVLLFYVGVVFAYYVVFPLVFAFMAGTTPDGVVMATDIAKYLDFVLSLFFAFGLAFEIPIATIIVVSMGMTTPDKLVEKRPYIIVGAFCVGMLLTPPDVISQTLLALPMWVLFEFGVFFSRIILRNKIKREKEENATGSESDATSTDAPSEDTADHSDDDDTKKSVVPTFDGELNLGDGVDDPTDPDRFVPLTEEELDAELDLIEDDDDDDLDEQESVAGDGLAADSVEQKLQQIQAFRDQGNEAGARELLYEVLADGDTDQVNVARNILVQLDEEEVPGP